jgi:hypothetical protein
MYIDNTFPPDGSPRLAKFLRMAGTMQPDDIAIAVDALIEQLDARAGDPDIEDDTEDRDIVDEPHDCDGDEEDCNGSEDDFMVHGSDGGMPGCPIADPGGVIASHGFKQQEEDDEDDGVALRAPHLDRIRRTRCKEVRSGRHLLGYRLVPPVRVVGGKRA